MGRISGKWNVLTKSPMGDNNALWELIERDGSYTGTLSNDGIVTEWESVSIDGNKFELKISLQLPFGLIPFTIAGEYNEADDTISGISKMKIGISKFKGKRVY